MKSRLAAFAASTVIALSLAVPTTASATTPSEDQVAGETAAAETAAGAPSATGSQITYSRDGKIYRARGDLSSPRVIATYDAATEDLDGLKASNDGKTIAYVLRNEQTWATRLIVRNVATGTVLRTISGTYEKVGRLLDISSDGKKLLRWVNGTEYITTVSTGTAVNARVPSGYDARGFTPDGLRLMLSSDYTVADLVIRRFNIATRQTAVTYRGANLGGTIKDVAADGSVLFERGAKSCGALITSAAARVDASGATGIVTNRDDVRAGSADGKWVIAFRASAPRTAPCKGDISETNLTFTIMNRTGAVAKVGTRVLAVTASQVDWSK